MSDAWGIALLGAVVSLSIGVLTVIAKCLHDIYKSLMKLNETFLKVISREECVENMDDHCDRIKSVDRRVDTLFSAIDVNTNRISKVESRVQSLEDRAKIWHKD